MQDFLHLPVQPSLREMGVSDAAVFLVSFSDEEQVIEIELAVITTTKLSGKAMDDVYALALTLYRVPVAKLFAHVLGLSRLEAAELKLNAGAYREEERS